jgi:acyl carrier protein
MSTSGAEAADSGGKPQRTAEDIQEWLINYLARALERSPDEIDVTVPFDDFALDSATAIGMTGELEDWLGKHVDPTLVYDYPTIEQFSQCLVDEA